MFENFVIFTDVVKLSSNVFHYLKQLNYSHRIFKLVDQIDITSFTQMNDLIVDEDGSIVSLFADAVFLIHRIIIAKSG